MGSPDEDFSPPDEDEGPDPHRDGSRRSARPTESMLDVDLDPVSEIEEDLRSEIEAGGESEERAREQLRYTGGIHQALKYVEKAVPIEDFGPDEEDADARKDLSIVLGKLLYKYEWGWIKKYEEEIFAFFLVSTLYGAPVVREYGSAVWTWYTQQVLSDGETGSRDARARQAPEREEHPTPGG